MKKVLIVEDDSFVGKMYERAFRLSGYDIAVVGDAISGLEHIASAQILPDVIILDIAMPKMGGMEFLQRLKADPRLLGVSTVVLTNSYSNDDEKIFLAAGADLFMVKIEHSSKDVVEKVRLLVDKLRVQKN